MSKLSPYKFKAWIQNLSGNLLNDRQKRLIYFFLPYGRKGCDKWNIRLAEIFGVCERTIRRDIKHLAKHSFIILTYPYMGQSNDTPPHPLTKRIATTIPYPTKAEWQAKSIVHLSKLTWTKMSTYQNCYIKNITKDTTKQSESGKTPDRKKLKPQRLDRQPSGSNTRWSGMDCRIIAGEKDRANLLIASGMTYKEAGNKILEDYKKKTTI